MEKNIGRMVWYPRSGGTARMAQLAMLCEPRRAFGAEIAQVKGGQPLTSDHQRIWSEAMSEYLRAGELQARAGSVATAQLARAIGLEIIRGGRVPARSEVRIRRLVHDLTAAQFRGTFPIFEKGAQPIQATLQLIDSPVWKDGPDGHSHLFFGVPAGLAQLLAKVNQVTFLHAPTWDAIRSADETASLLWVVLEGERIPPTGWSYRLFSGAEGGILDESGDCVVDWLHLNFTVRREAVRRLRSALAAIIAADSRYAGTEIVRDYREKGVWYLRVTRGEYVREPEAGGLPRKVDGAWRDVNFGRLHVAAFVQI